MIDEEYVALLESTVAALGREVMHNRVGAAHMTTEGLTDRLGFHVAYAPTMVAGAETEIWSDGDRVHVRCSWPLDEEIIEAPASVGVE